MNGKKTENQKTGFEVALQNRKKPGKEKPGMVHYYFVDYSLGVR
jgi:hypothetical protein